MYQLAMLHPGWHSNRKIRLCDHPAKMKEAYDDVVATVKRNEEVCGLQQQR